MKNKIFIDIDTERSQQILFGKPPEIEQPKTAEDAGKMILNDIVCISEALCSLIHVCDQNGYGKKEDLVNACANLLHEFLKFKPEPLSGNTTSDETKSV